MMATINFYGQYLSQNKANRPANQRSLNQQSLNQNSNNQHVLQRGDKKKFQYLHNHGSD